MKKLLLKTLKNVGFVAILLLNNQFLKAQVTFESLFTGDFNTGSFVETVTGQILKGTTGTGAEYFRTKVNPLSVVRDENNNVAVAYNSVNRILRKDDGQNNITIIQLSSLSGGVRGIAIDKDSEFLYQGGSANNLGRVNMIIWKNDGTPVSAGYYSGKSVGTLTTDIKTIPFIRGGEQYFVDGAAMRTTYNFGGQVRGLAFDSKGNLYMANRDDHKIIKVSIVKKKVSGEVNVGNSIELEDASGLKAGDFVGGLNIQELSYIGDVSGNTITLVNNTGAARNVSDVVPDGTTLVFATGITNIAGNGTAGNILGSTAETSQLDFSTTLQTDHVQIGLAFDTEDNLYVADINNKRILKIETVIGDITASSPISVFAAKAPATDQVRGLAIGKNNNVYFTNTSNHTLYSTEDGTNIKVVAGSGARLTLGANNLYSLVQGSNVVQMNMSSSHASITDMLDNAGVGMYVRSSSDNKITGAKITAIDKDAKNITLNMVSARDVALGSGLNNSGTLLLVPDDGFVTTESNKGYLDGPGSLTILDRGTKEDLVVADVNGVFIRVLKGVSTLPVTLAGDFEAKLNSTGTVGLYWKTASEQDNSRFIIKRSTDGITYEEIEAIQSKGTTGASYHTTDTNPVSGVNYYQLSQTDINGTTKILGIKFVNVVVTTKSDVVVYPNPIKNNQFTIKTTSENNTINVILADLNSSKVFESLIPGNGSNTYTVQLPEKVAAGIYLLSVDGKYVQKLVIE
ncbi:hypothetical protein [Pseudopedobacter beijingensis]|uniref:Por secretion system C-terminal sorting domain-containing protein n=1 Tax=Pseudopedobacter beijingensis TaxID=1207056 RepID=A0ABW4I9X3_9SPHI